MKNRKDVMTRVGVEASRKSAARNGSMRSRLLSATALAALVGWGVLGFRSPSLAQLPTGGTVVGGQATITTGANQVTVTQSTNRGVIDWRSFSIGPNGRVDFQQPGTSSVTLNRVTGPDPSVIAGQLTANGQIVLVNGAGVFFANGAQVNVGALVASTANISNPQRFMDGGAITFDVPSPNANARVENAGTITVRDGGLVGLVGHSASSSGVINARLGRVTIGGAETFTVDLAGDGLINFQIGQPVSRQPMDAQGRKVALASNTGTINADGGVVTMTARAAGSVVDNVVNVGGAIRAQAVSQEGGVLILDGGDGGTVNISGTLDVSGKGAGQRGGQVTATARGGKVNVAATTVIDASGDSGGGRVSIGGSYQGQGPIANARDTHVAAGARINADATRQGSGGTVIVWSDNATVFGGTITARGGQQRGSGGFVETSGKVTLSILEGASVSAGAVSGQAGQWLLDPTDVMIDATQAGIISATLQGGTNVTITTSSSGTDPGDITLLASATITWTTTNILTFTADRHIFLNGTIAGTSGTVNLSAGGQILQTGGSVSAVNLRATAAGGDVQLTSTANDVDFIAGSAATNFRYVDADDVSLGIGTVIVLGAGTIAVVENISMGAGGYVDIAANQISITTAVGTLSGPVTALVGIITGGAAPTDNPGGVVVLRPTTAGTAMVVGGTGTGLNEADLITAIRAGTLRIGSIGRTAGTLLGGVTTDAESAAGIITIQGLNFLDPSAGTPAVATLVIESAAGGTAISQTGPIRLSGGLATAVVGSGAVELTSTTNSTTALAHIARESDTTLGTQSGDYRYVDNSFIPVVRVAGSGVPLVGARDSDTTPGLPPNTAILTAGSNVTLVSVTQGIELIDSLIAPNATVRLSALTPLQNIFQQSTGGLVATSVLAVSGGSVDFSAAAMLNRVQNISGSAASDFRLINAIGVTVPAGGVAGDSLVPGLAGVSAGTASTLELAIASGDIVVSGTLAAPDGLILLRRVLGATGSDIILNGTSFNTGFTPANLVILDLTGSPTLTPANFATLMNGVTPANGTSNVPPGPNTDGGIVLNGVIAGNTTMWLFGGSGSTVGGSGTFGLLGVYVQHSNPIALTGSVRQIDPTTAHANTANFNEPFDATTFAGFYVRRSGAAVTVQTFNSCPIASGICPTPHHDVPPLVDWWPPPPSDFVGPPLRIDVASDRGPPTPLNLSTIILVNQGNEYFFNVDEERRKQRAARGGK